MRRNQQSERLDEALARVEAGEKVTAVAEDLDVSREHLSREVNKRRRAKAATTRVVFGLAVGI